VAVGSIVVVGLGADPPSKTALRAIEGADLLVGGRRHLECFAAGRARRVAVEGDVVAVLDSVAAAVDPTQGSDFPLGATTAGTRVCVLASGDPGFFGIVRALGARFGSAALDVHPAPSSVSVAFARIGLAWDDAVIVSAHGRPLADAARRAAGSAKAAVLTSPTATPEALGRELQTLGCRHSRVVVCSRLGEADEEILDTDLEGLAGGRFDPMSVVVLLAGADVVTGSGSGRTLAWGRPEAEFAHRGGMITKAEVRAVALGKLGVPPAGVFWDLGGGSGSVAVEAALLAPALRVLAVDRDAAASATIARNAADHGARVEVVEGEAPACLDGLPDPDRIFVGGGGLDVLDAAVARLRTGGRVVAAFTAMDRAAAAHDRLGHLVAIAVNRAMPLPGGGIRLQAENPVFVAWGPGE